MSGEVTPTWVCPCCDMEYTTGAPFIGERWVKCWRCLAVFDGNRRVLKTHKPKAALHRQLQKLGARDGWRCWICNGKVKPGAQGKQAPTRDHVVPRLYGGSNALTNLRLAHAICNHRRGAPEPAQSPGGEQ